MNSGPNTPRSERVAEAISSQREIAVSVSEALYGLSMLYEKNLPGGVSQADMARATGISPTQIQRVIVAQASLKAEHVPLLPTAARRAVLAVLDPERPIVARSVESNGRRITAVCGELAREMDAALADGVLDDLERARLGVVLDELIARAKEAKASLEVGTAKTPPQGIAAVKGVPR